MSDWLVKKFLQIKFDNYGIIIYVRSSIIIINHNGRKIMNNILSIKAMAYWVNRFGNVPADEDYVEFYLNNSNAVEEESSYDQADQVIDYTIKDMQEEINYMDNIVNTFHTEDCESMEELSELINSSLK